MTERVNILLVDDRPSNLLALTAVLARPEYNLVLASSGEEALAAVLREEFALILMDVAMPGMDGLETAALLKQRRRTRHIPILFVTASVHDVESITRAYRSGAVDYLQKPVEPYLVRAKVEVFVELHRQRREIERQAELLQVSAVREQEYEMRKREGERWRFLDEASIRLLNSLDPEVTLKGLTAITVPRLADAAAVYVPDDKLRLLDRQGSGPEAEAMLERLDLAAVDAVRQEAVSVLDEAAGGKLLIVPLSARGHSLGVMALARGASTPSFNEQDRAVAEELGRRAAIAADNARLYAEARSAVRGRDEFLSIAAHELRTPLTTLRLSLQSLARQDGLRDLAEGSGVEQKLHQAMRASARLGKLVDHLLDVSRIASRRLELQREPLDLAELAQEMVDRLQEEAARAGCELRLEVEDGPVCGQWDRLRLEQVMDNLLTNALKYAPGKPVDVRVEARGDAAVFTVRDRGIGIPEEAVERIFGRFERAVPIHNYGGLGLGLYLAQQFVHAHGGQIRVHSRPGEGSTFAVELPCAATSGVAESAGSVPGASAGPDGSGPAPPPS